jgi:hypothetical protein
MKLSDLAFACYVYSRMSNYDKSYTYFLNCTNNRIDIRINGHRIALIKWLNSWGCRQFALNYHNLASEEISDWYEEFGNLLFPRNMTLLELSDNDIVLVSKAYAKLVGRTASKRKTKNAGEVDVMIGPTGAAKILFALRPNALAPWDESIRDKLNLDGSPSSYTNYLRIVKDNLEELSETCKRNGYDLSELPNLVGRPGSSLAKLVDEYFWVTISRNCPPPAHDDLARWVNWQ